MKFEEVLPALREGCSIRHVSWPEGYFVYMTDGHLNDQQCRLFEIMNSGMINWLSTDGWEIFEKPKIDWSYIIENKCLCWFWDDDDEDVTLIKYLTSYEKNKRYPFVGYSKGGGHCPYKHCRPVRKDEGTFYEDEGDEDNS